MTQDLRVNGGRLWSSLMEMAEIGATAKGGVCRLAASDEDRRGRDLFRKWCEEIGLAVTVDAMGSMFARRDGHRSARPPVTFGSHLDSQPTGGKYDGALGVLAGLEVMRTLHDHSVETETPLELVNWTNEEGARFAPAMVASGVFAGVFDLAFAHSRTDRDGKTQGGELARIGYEGPAPVGGRMLGAYLELHIEQGPILEAEGRQIGIVTGGQGVRWYDVTVEGAEAHAGPTPMDHRKDALLAASDMIVGINRIALDRSPAARSTVGDLTLSPGSRNTVPGRVTFTVDMRHPEIAGLDSMTAALRALGPDIADRHGVGVSIDDIFDTPPVAFDAACVDAVRQGAATCGYAAREIVSGAGHDAFFMARVCPTAMIFVPCKDGISHNELEEAKPEDCEAGANVLLHAVLRTAGC